MCLLLHEKQSNKRNGVMGVGMYMGVDMRMHQSTFQKAWAEKKRREGWRGGRY